MTAHTPGPLRHTKVGGQSRDWQIVTVATGGYVGQATTEANAAMFAAAPELYEALRVLADYAEAQARGDDDAVPMHLRCIDSAAMALAITEARAALAKVSP